MSSRWAVVLAVVADRGRIARREGLQEALVELLAPLGAALVDDQGRVHLVGQRRVPLARYSWEMPEGGCEPGEDPLQSARRDVSGADRLGGQGKGDAAVDPPRHGDLPRLPRSRRPERDGGSRNKRMDVWRLQCGS